MPTSIPELVDLLRRSNGEVDHWICLRLTFAGQDDLDLYVISVGGNTRNEDGELARALFPVRNQARGVPRFCSNIGTPNR